MASTTIRIWDGADGSKTKNLWGSQSIANINAIINNALDPRYTITKAVIQVYANFDGALGLANVYMKYGFGSTNSISAQLGGEHKLTKDDTAYSVDITSYFTNKRDPKTIATSYGSYFVANIYTSNVVVGSSGALHLSNVDLYIEYEYTHRGIHLLVEPTNGGTVTGGGYYEAGTTATVKAIPNNGFVFDGWYMGSSILNTDNPYDFTASSERVMTAKFKAFINNILIDEEKPKKIFIDNQEVKAIFVDTTKVYG